MVAFSYRRATGQGRLYLRKEHLYRGAVLNQQRRDRPSYRDGANRPSFSSE